MEETTLEVLDPSGVTIAERKTLAPRLETFEGKKIGLVWNTKPNGEVLLEEIGELLKERYPGAEILPRTLLFGWREPPPGELEGIAKDIDAAVFTTGD